MSRHRGLLVCSMALAIAAPAFAEKHVTFKKPTPRPEVVVTSTPSASIPEPPATVATVASAYWLGVRIAPADETLRSHLHLGERGLVVRDVILDAPAHAAGFAAHDILLEVVGKETATPLRQLEDLVRAVDAVGKDAQPLQIKLLREGKETTLSAVPAKRVVATRN